MRNIALLGRLKLLTQDTHNLAKRVILLLIKRILIDNVVQALPEIRAFHNLDARDQSLNGILVNRIDERNEGVTPTQLLDRYTLIYRDTILSFSFSLP